MSSAAERRYTFSQSAADLRTKKVFVPRHYWNLRDLEVEQLAKAQNLCLVPIEQLWKERIISTFDGHGSPEAKYKGRGKIPYIRVKDIVNWEIYKDPTSRIPEDVYRRMTRNKKHLKPNDVLFVKRGSYRIGTVAVSYTHLTLPTIYSV